MSFGPSIHLRSDVISPGAPAAPRDAAVGVAERKPRRAFTEQIHTNWLTERIDRYRKFCFAFVAVFMLLSFNGKWRIGTDSAVYRGLAHSLATGHGYHFGDWAPKQVYPGLPVLLAGVEKVFGTGAFMPTLMIFLMGVATLVVVYRLILLNYPRWMAVCVTCGVGCNSAFIVLCNEISTDVPFLLGLVLALYGWELLRRASGKKWLPAVGVFIVGLALAGLTRPTFWALALALLSTCVWGLIYGPRRKLPAICLGALVVVWIALVAFDPRARGFNPFGGKYEAEFIQNTQRHAVEIFDRQYPRMMEEHLLEAFFGEHMHLPDKWAGPWKVAPAVLLGSALLAGACLMFLRQPLWGFLVFFTLVATVMNSTVPRYYMMILPLLMLSALLLLVGFIHHLPKIPGEVFLFFGLCLITFTNLAAGVGFFKEQRSPNFYAHYHDGKFQPHMAMAELIKQHTPPDAKLLAPQGNMIAYLSGRHVYTQREALGDVASGGNLFIKGALDFPKQLQKIGLNYIVIPARYYVRDEQTLYWLIKLHVIVPTEEVARTPDGKMILYKVKIVVPADDGWRNAKLHHRLPATRKSATRPTTRRSPTTHKTPTTHRATTRRTPTTRRKPATKPVTRPTTSP